MWHIRCVSFFCYNWRRIWSRFYCSLALQLIVCIKRHKRDCFFFFSKKNEDGKCNNSSGSSLWAWILGQFTKRTKKIMNVDGFACLTQQLVYNDSDNTPLLVAEPCRTRSFHQSTIAQKLVLLFVSRAKTNKHLWINKNKLFGLRKVLSPTFFIGEHTVRHSQQTCKLW